jgi:soluble lytic murein transglycosylase-like protein
VRWWRAALLVAIVAVLTVVLANAAGAHTSEAQQEWYDQWTQRAKLGLTPELIAELTDFQRRHEPPSVTVTNRTPNRSAPTWAGSPGVEQWRGLVASHDGWDVDTMLCLMEHESRGVPTAVNPSSGAAGLLQIMPFWWDHYGGDRFDPVTNVSVGHLIWQQQGYQAWSPYNRGLCR